MRPLSKSFEVIGYWFLPGNSDRKIPGTLSYTPERTELRLLESFQPFPISMIQPLWKYPLIFGVTQESKPISILGAVRDKVSMNMGTAGVLSPETWLCPLTIYGDHVKSAATFGQMRCRVPGLQIWHSNALVEFSSTTNSDTGVTDTNYRILDRKLETADLPDEDAKVDWYIEYSMSTSEFDIAVETSGWFAIRPSTPQPIQWYLQRQHKITILLTLLAGTPMFPDVLSVSTDRPHSYASVLFTRHEVRYCDYKNTSDFFMPRSALGVELSEVIRKWFRVWPRMASPSDLAMSIYGSEKLWQHVEFLSWMQALEGVHRALCDGLYMDKKDYAEVEKSLRAAIPSNLKSAHKESLRSRLRYGNEFSLARRLNELAERLTKSTRQRIFGADGKIPRSWIDTRNYYTHWDEELRSNTLDGQGMLNANLRMSLFLRLLYLDLVGIPPAALSAALGGYHRDSDWLKQINAREIQAKSTEGKQ